MPTPTGTSHALDPDTSARARHATNDIRELVHRTRHHDAIADPADICRLLGELATLAAMLPQLFNQLRRWLHNEHDDTALGSDSPADPAELVAAAAAQLTRAHDHTCQIADLLDMAHQHVAHLTTTK